MPCVLRVRSCTDIFLGVGSAGATSTCVADDDDARGGAGAPSRRADAVVQDLAPAAVEKNSAEAARFAYDPFGRRVEKAAAGVTTTYTYAGLDILREARSDGAAYTYIHGPGIDEPLARIDNGTNAWAYYHADASVPGLAPAHLCEPGRRLGAGMWVTRTPEWVPLEDVPVSIHQSRVAVPGIGTTALMDTSTSRST